MNRFLLTLIITLATVLTALGQSVAIKNNLAYDALLTPNLSLEAKLANRWTLDLQGGPTSSSIPKTLRRRGIKLPSGATGWCSLRLATGSARLSMAGS